MKRMIENMTGNYSSSASVVDGTLILSLPDAINPVVWRLDLGKARASALEIRDQEDGSFLLLLKTPRGDVNDIASFSSRGRAVSALMSVSRAMEQAHGQIYPIANDSDHYNPSRLPVLVKNHTSNKKKQKGKSVLASLVAIVLIVILLGTLMNLTPGPAGPLSATSPASGNQVSATAQQTGVAVSADDFLKNR